MPKTGGIPEQTQKVIAVVAVVLAVGLALFMARIMGFWPGQGGDVPPKRLVLTPQQIQKLRSDSLAHAQGAAAPNAAQANGGDK